MDVLVIVLVMAGAGLAVVALFQWVWLVPQAQARNVERFGKFRKTLGPGLNFVLPFADRVGPKIDLRERVISVQASVITNDNVDVTVNVATFFRVPDEYSGGSRKNASDRKERDMNLPAYKAQYRVQDYVRAIEKLTATALRNVVADWDLHPLLTARAEVNDAVHKEVASKAADWGVDVTRIEIVTIGLPQAIQVAMEDRQGEIFRATSEAATLHVIADEVEQKGLRVLFEFLRGLIGSRWVQDGAERSHTGSRPG